ncbi:MAG: four helix bundle protein [Bacilli bacterium]
MLNDFKLYKKVLDMFYYTYFLTNKYPKSEKESLVLELKQSLYKLMNYTVCYQKERSCLYLKSFKVELQIFLVLIRVSYKLKYINGKNYASFSRKIIEMDKIVDGLNEEC